MLYAFGQSSSMIFISIFKFLNLYAFRNARCLCAYCGGKTRRDNLTPHCKKIHNAVPLALRYGQLPTKPRMLNFEKYCADPINVIPESVREYNGTIHDPKYSLDCNTE